MVFGWLKVHHAAGGSWTSDFSFMLSAPTAMVFVARAGESSGGNFPVAPKCIHQWPGVNVHLPICFFKLDHVLINSFAGHCLTSFHIHLHLCVCVHLCQYQYAFSFKIDTACYTVTEFSVTLSRAPSQQTAVQAINTLVLGDPPASDVASCGLVWKTWGKSHQHCGNLQVRRFTKKMLMFPIQMGSLGLPHLCPSSSV